MKHTINSTTTKQMLADALIALSSQKSFAKITVSEIVSYCNINRKTFYYHFTDIYDLLEWHLSNEVFFAISSFDPIKNSDKIISYAVNYMNQHTYLKNFIQDTFARDKITQLLYAVIYPKASEILQELPLAQTPSIDPDFKEFLAKNISRILIYSTFDAIEHPDEYEIEKLQQYISTLFQLSTNGYFHS